MIRATRDDHSPLDGNRVLSSTDAEDLLMTERDHYRTIAREVEQRIKVQRSEFIAFALPFDSEEAFFSRLESLQRRFFDASHHCWAFRLLQDAAERARSSDAGEPGGTAGKPILSAIESHEFFDVGVVVVRYFGGTKLGTGGLSRAYRDAATAALDDASPEERYLYERIVVDVPFSATSIIYRMIDPPHVRIAGETYGDGIELALDVRRSRAEAFASDLDSKRLRFRRH
jgi:uncharacterized YigZ family protein